MATGWSLPYVMAHPGQTALVARYLDRVPRGDPIARELLSRLGYLVESALFTGDAQYDRWFFWKKDRPKTKQDLTGGMVDVLGQQEAARAKAGG